MLQPKATDGKAEVPIKLTALNPKSKIRDRKSASGEQAGWQRRFWEHQIRDETDFAQLGEHIHGNPGKRGLVPAQKIGLIQFSQICPRTHNLHPDPVMAGEGVASSSLVIFLTSNSTRRAYQFFEALKTAVVYNESVPHTDA
jgi:hypothetical protein